MTAVSTLLSTGATSAYLASGYYLLENTLTQFLIASYAINTFIVAPILFVCIRVGRSGIAYAVAIGILAGAILWLINNSAVAAVSVESGRSPTAPLLGFIACAVCMWWVATQRYFGGPIVAADQLNSSVD